MFYTDEEISVITGFLNGYLVRDHASAKVRESYIRISAGLQSHTLTKDDYVWLENALLFLRPYWWSDREDGKMLMDAFLHNQRVTAIFFLYFLAVFSGFLSILIPFLTSCDLSFPCVPHLSVAFYVVKCKASPEQFQRGFAVFSASRFSTR